MIRPNATRTLALNGLTITATISRDDETVFKTCGEKYSLEDVGKFREEYEMKCKKRQEYYDMRNKEKSIENSKDSLDLMYEKKMGIGKTSSSDTQSKEKEFSANKSETTIHQKRRRDSSLDKIEKLDDWDCFPAEFYKKPDGIPRSVSDILEIQRRKIKKWSEVDFYKTTSRVSRKDNAFTLAPLRNKKVPSENENAKRNFECFEYQSVLVNVKEDIGKKCKSGGGDKDKIFRNIRSRSATIPRKWGEHSLSTPSTTSGAYVLVCSPSFYPPPRPPPPISYSSILYSFPHLLSLSFRTPPLFPFLLVILSLSLSSPIFFSLFFLSCFPSISQSENLSPMCFIACSVIFSLFWRNVLK